MRHGHETVAEARWVPKRRTWKGKTVGKEGAVVAMVEEEAEEEAETKGLAAAEEKLWQRGANYVGEQE